MKHWTSDGIVGIPFLLWSIMLEQLKLDTTSRIFASIAIIGSSVTTISSPKLTSVMFFKAKGAYALTISINISNTTRQFGFHFDFMPSKAVSSIQIQHYSSNLWNWQMIENCYVTEVRTLQEDWFNFSLNWLSFPICEIFTPAGGKEYINGVFTPSVTPSITKNYEGFFLE